MNGSRVAVVGTGYVGLVTGAGLASLGHVVTCVDLRQDIVDAVNRGETLIHEPGLPELIQQGLAEGRFRATTDLAAAVAASDVTFVAVGTPSTCDGIDLSYVARATAAIADALAEESRAHVLVVKSTVVPGTTEGIVRETLTAHAGRRTEPIGICMNPEFLREGTAVADFMHPDRIVIGQSDEQAGDALARLYASFSCPVIRTSCRNAELIKYASNSLLALLVSFSNELASLCERMPGADIDEVMNGLHLDRRLSPLVSGERVTPEILSYLRAGSGFGGSCLPKDVTALRHFARSLGVATPMLDATMAVNERRPDQVVDLVERAAGGLTGKVIAVLGIAFKPGTDDVRDSPALELAKRLAANGAVVRAYDPLLSHSPARTLPVALSDTPENALRGADAAVIATAWPEFRQWDWERLHRLMAQPVIVDGRRVLGSTPLPRAMAYWSIGRQKMRGV